MLNMKKKVAAQVVADMRLNSSFGPGDLKRIHAVKKKISAAIEWLPREAG